MKRRRLTWRDKWRRFRLGAVERYYFELKDNTTHPFQDLGDGFYYITVRSDKFVFGVGLVISTVTCFTLFCLFVDFFSFPLVLFLCTISYGIFSMYGHLSTKELIISRNGGYLMRIKGSNKILIEEPVHNCYIKLQRKFDANRKPHFYLILGGYKLDDIRISTMASHDGALRLLGGRLASSMGINYFDYDNNSTLHKIVHYPGFTTLKAADEEFQKFIEDHGILDDEVHQALAVENLPPDTNLVPEALTERIQDNYKRGAIIDVQEKVKSSRRGVINIKDIVTLRRTAKIMQHIQMNK